MIWFPAFAEGPACSGLSSGGWWFRGDCARGSCHTAGGVVVRAAGCYGGV